MKNNQFKISLEMISEFTSLVIFTILTIIIAFSNPGNIWIVIFAIFGAGLSIVSIVLTLIGIGYGIKTKKPISICISIEEDKE